MKIKKYKKLSTSKYLIELENNESLTLYEETIIKYNLLYKKELEVDKLNEILEFNEYGEAYEKCIKFICKKLRCKKEVTEFLRKNSYNSHIIDTVIERLEKNNILNENNYVKSYINDKLYLTKDGPLKIEKELTDLGIDSRIIYDNISLIDKSIVEDKVRKYIEKRRKTNSKYSQNMINNKIRQELLNLGYDIELINMYLDIDNEGNDDILIKKDYEKSLNKYSKKYNGRELDQKIKNYLYSKGYKIDDINKLF